MGNEFSNPEVPFSFDDSKPLAKLIKDYYKNEHKFLNSNDAVLSNYIKKRVCCRGGVTNNANSVQISLPSYNKTAKVGEKVVQTTLDLNLFTDNELADFKKNCTFNNNEFFNLTTNAKGIVANQKCNDFYNSFCNKVYEHRKKDYANNLKSGWPFTGPYNDNDNQDDKNNPYKTVNPFIDCNCLNSAFIKSDQISNKNSISKNQHAQTLDLACGDLVKDRTAFVHMDQQIESLCINNMDVNDIKAVQNSGVNLSQKCSNGGMQDEPTTNNSKNVTSNPTPPTPATSNPTPPANNPTPPTPPASNPTPPASNPTPVASTPTPAASNPTPAANNPTPPTPPASSLNTDLDKSIPNLTLYIQIGISAIILLIILVVIMITKK